MINTKNMGVINITPDSFSDGGCFNSLESFSKKISEVLIWADIIDIGAESSAPFNKSISVDEELNRYERIFFPYIENNNDPGITLSIDTYKIDVFKIVAKKVYRSWPNTQFIFNDVSGKIDSELSKLFLDYTMPKFSYVFSHNLAPSREKTLEHMNYCLENISDELFYQELVNYLKIGLKKIPTHIEVFLDPCFGFSKTRSQNQYLLKFFNNLINEFSQQQSFVYGISRKSFLRFPIGLDIKNRENLDIVNHMQTICFYELMKKSNQSPLIFRVHDKTSLIATQNCKKIFDI